MTEITQLTQYLRPQNPTGFPAPISITGTINIAADVVCAAYENSSATAEHTVNLPSAVVGQRFLFINRHRYFAINVDPIFSQRFRQYPNGVNVRFLKDSWAVIECREAGIWDFVESSGFFQQGYHPALPSPDGAGAFRTIYLSNSGNDNNNGVAVGTPKKTLRGISRIARPGDLVIVAPGTYDDVAENQWVFDNLPQGNADNPIHFRCDTAFGARFAILDMNAPNASVWDIQRSKMYLDITNLVFWSPGSQQKRVRVCNVRFFSCGFVGGSQSAGSNNSTLNVDGIGGNKFGLFLGAKDVLFEDCVALGKGGRYKFLAYGGKNIIFRRCISRWDQGWDSDGSAQAGDFGLYDTINSEAQNCLSIDSLRPVNHPGLYKSAFFLEQNYLHAPNLALRGCMVVNNDGTAYSADGLTFQPVTTPSSGTRTPGTPPWTFSNRKMDPLNWLIENCVAAKTRGGFVINVTTKVKNCTSAWLTQTNTNFVLASNPRWSTGSEFRNNVAVRVAAGSTAFSIPSHSLSDNNRDYEDMAAANAAGLYHPTYADIGSTINTSGAGAYVLKRIGAPGSYIGFPNYRQHGDGSGGEGTATFGDLWPWPNEAAIKTFMQAVETEQSITPRGFTASNLTLTEYVFGILGTAGPI